MTDTPDLTGDPASIYNRGYKAAMQDERNRIEQLEAKNAVLERLLNRGLGFIEGVKRAGHWIGPSWGDETNLWRDELRQALEPNP